MLKRILFITFFLLSTSCILSSSVFAAFTSDEAAELLAEATAAAQKFTAETKGADAVIASAKSVWYALR